MPEPQRSGAVRILVEVARKASVPPAYLTAHVQNSIHLGVVYAARREAQQRMLQEVEGMTRAMLARAFRRDVRRMRGSELSAGQPEFSTTEPS